MGDLRILYRNGTVSLRRLDLVNVRTLNISQTGLPEDGAPAWAIRFGAENPNLAADGYVTAFAEGGYGHGWEIAGLSAYAMGIGRLTAFEEERSHAEAGAVLGAIAGLGDSMKLIAEGGIRQQIDGGTRTITFAWLESRFGHSPDFDFRAGIAFQDGYHAGSVVETNFSLSYYW